MLKSGEFVLFFEQLLMKEQQCTICSSSRPEVKVLLAFLRHRILRQSQQYVPDYKEEEPERDHSDGFSRLLILIFGRTYTSHASFLSCPHVKLTRYFRRKLKCDNITFNGLCSEIANKLAERNYQLEALNTQITSTARTALREASSPLAEVIASKLNHTRINQQIVSTGSITRPASQTLIQGANHPQFQSIPSFWMSHPVVGFPWLYGSPHNHN